MKLPGTWEVYGSRTRSGEFWLCDPCNDESMMKREAAELNCYSVEVLKNFYIVFKAFFFNAIGIVFKAFF